MARKAKVKKINHEEMLERIRNIKKLQSEAKALNEVIEAEKKAVIEVMTEHELDTYEVDVFTVTYKAVEQERVDSSKLKTERPDIFDKYSKLVTSRRFVIA